MNKSPLVYFDLLPNELNLFIFSYIVDTLTVINLKDFEPFESLLSSRINLINLVNMTTDIRKYINLREYFDVDDFLQLISLYRRLMTSYNYTNKNIKVFIEEFDNAIGDMFPGKNRKTFLKDEKTTNGMITDRIRDWKAYTSFIISDPKIFQMMFLPDLIEEEKLILSKILMVNPSKVLVILSLNIFGFSFEIEIPENNFYNYFDEYFGVRFPLYHPISEEEFKNLYFHFYLRGAVKEISYNVY
jgi:hypothetical protein